MLLFALRRQAREVGGDVTVLLGNHEVMTALGNEAYCTVSEYLSFATAKQQEKWGKRVEKAQRRLYRDYRRGGPILPLGPRLEAWKINNVPGRAALRRALGPRGRLGRELRALPVAIVAGSCVFCHAALTPMWVRKGIDGLNQTAWESWSDASFYADLPPGCLFRATQGPLWNRTVTMCETTATRKQLRTTLRRLAVKRMVVGHTVTAHIPDCERGQIVLRHEGRLVCIDVGLGLGDNLSRAVLVIDGPRGWQWTPDGHRELWNDDRD